MLTEVFFLQEVYWNCFWSLSPPSFFLNSVNVYVISYQMSTLYFLFTSTSFSRLRAVCIICRKLENKMYEERIKVLQMLLPRENHCCGWCNFCLFYVYVCAYLCVCMNIYIYLLKLCLIFLKQNKIGIIPTYSSVIFLYKYTPKSSCVIKYFFI